MKKNTVFSQILQLLNREHFRKIIKKYGGDRYTKTLNCWQQFKILIYSQSKGLKSLRDIQISLQSNQRKWYHLGLASTARSTLSDANNKRNCEIFGNLFYDF